MFQTQLFHFWHFKLGCHHFFIRVQETGESPETFTHRLLPGRALKHSHIGYYQGEPWNIHTQDTTSESPETFTHRILPVRALKHSHIGYYQWEPWNIHTQVTIRKSPKTFTHRLLPGRAWNIHTLVTTRESPKTFTHWLLPGRALKHSHTGYYQKESQNIHT